MSVVYLKQGEPHCVHAVRSLSPTRHVGADLLVERRWRPNSGGVTFRELPKAPKASPSPKLRLSQLRQQARRFTGFESYGKKERAELRLIPRELHSYEDLDNGIMAGAVFAIAHNTNPEAYLMREIRESSESPDWHYALARFTFAEIHVLLDRKEVWKQPAIGTARSNSPYYIFHVPRQQTKIR